MKMLGISLLLSSLGTALPALAHGPVPAATQDAETAKFNADRAAILAMAGTYRVRFDFTETTPWVADYTPILPKSSGGHEVIRVIEDNGNKISLQHILVHQDKGKTSVTKHWRQDWQYEPDKVLVYRGPGRWALEDVPERMRRGRWSQTVWQTDDSPRYGGWGEFSNEAGVARWRSNWTWRPLPRRDAVRKPVYDRFMAINRHQWTPTGWIHWQDNTKLGAREGKLTAIVQEQGLNSYNRFNGFDAARADAYWAKTQGYWATVRAAWQEVVRRDSGIAISEQPEWGSVVSERLMTMADKVEDGSISVATASADARRTILTETLVGGTKVASGGR